MKTTVKLRLKCDAIVNNNDGRELFPAVTLDFEQITEAEAEEHVKIIGALCTSIVTTLPHLAAILAPDAPFGTGDFQ